jgi:transposase
MDLRERVVAALEEEGLSRNEAAARFGVGISTAINWVRRFKDTGSVAPARMGGHKPKAIRGEHEAWLRERLGERDFTLRGLVGELAARGLKVDYHTVRPRPRPALGPNAGQRPLLADPCLVLT